MKNTEVKTHVNTSDLVSVSMYVDFGAQSYNESILQLRIWKSSFLEY